MAANQAAAPDIDALLKEIDEKTKKIEKLKKYIARVEEDGDRLANELVIANSYRSFIDSITNPLFMVNSALEISYANQAFFELTESTPEILREKAKCSDLFQCGSLRRKCLLKECFETKEPITAFRCKFVSSSERRFRLVVNALPICNVATGAILGGIEVFQEVVEDTTKYLMFSLAEQEFGMSTRNLREIIPMTEVVAMSAGEISEGSVAIPEQLRRGFQENSPRRT